MNLLRIEGFGSRMGWDSPVKEVVNPAFINLESRNGLGWLEGFNEMMVRCGYRMDRPSGDRGRANLYPTRQGGQHAGLSGGGGGGRQRAV